jgi:hypothetical protein
MQLPRNVIEDYTRGINGISERSRAALAEMLEHIDFSQDVATVRAQVVQAMQTVCGASTEATAMLANEFYDGLRTFELGEELGAQALSGRDPAATEGAVRAFAKKLDEGKVDVFKNLCLDRVDYECKVAASQTCLNNAKRDPRAPRFARVAYGETCDFCLMLASRGWVYHTEAAASHAHSGCDCRVVPSWKARSVEGYEPAALYDQWQDAIDEKAAKRAERNGTTPDEERKKIMDAYGESAKKAKRANRKNAPKRNVSYAASTRQARTIKSKIDEKSTKADVLEAMVKADDQWSKSNHPDEVYNDLNQYFRRKMDEYGITMQDVIAYRKSH